MIDDSCERAPLTVGSAMPKLMVLGTKIKEVEQAMETASVKILFLLLSQLPGSCNEFLPRLPLVMEYDLTVTN